jgi:hypothetical protein
VTRLSPKASLMGYRALLARSWGIAPLRSGRSVRMSLAGLVDRERCGALERIESFTITGTDGTRETATEINCSRRGTAARVRPITRSVGAAAYGEPMTELKTRKTSMSVAEFLSAVADPVRRVDAQAACALMTEVTGQPPVMWGTSIVGFGSYHYRYATGREADWPAVGLSPRKQALTLYISTGFDTYQELLGRLGPHTVGKSCLYLKRLSDVDEEVLRSLVRGGFQALHATTVRT